MMASIASPLPWSLATTSIKIAMNGDWTLNYGSDGAENGPNYILNQAADGSVTFVYDPATHLVTVTTQ